MSAKSTAARCNSRLGETVHPGGLAPRGDCCQETACRRNSEARQLRVPSPIGGWSRSGDTRTFRSNRMPTSCRRDLSRQTEKAFQRSNSCLPYPPSADVRTNRSGRGGVCRRKCAVLAQFSLARLWLVFAILGHVGLFSLASCGESTAVKVLRGIPDAQGTAGKSFIHSFSESAFSGVVHKWKVSEAGQSRLPTWLDYDAQTRTFKGVPPFGESGQTYISVVAEGEGGKAKATDVFSIDVEPSTLHKERARWQLRADQQDEWHAWKLLGQTADSQTEDVKCDHEENIVTVVITAAQELSAMRGSQRHSLLSAAARHLNASADHLTLASPGAWRGTSEALAAGAGNAQSDLVADANRAQLWWNIACGNFLAKTPAASAVAKVEQSALDGSLAAAIGVPVSSWQLVHRRSRRQTSSAPRLSSIGFLRSTPVPTPTVTLLPPTTIDVETLTLSPTESLTDIYQSPISLTITTPTLSVDLSTSEEFPKISPTSTSAAIFSTPDESSAPTDSPTPTSTTQDLSLTPDIVTVEPTDSFLSESIETTSTVSEIGSRLSDETTSITVVSSTPDRETTTASPPPQASTTPISSATDDITTDFGIDFTTIDIPDITDVTSFMEVTAITEQLPVETLSIVETTISPSLSSSSSRLTPITSSERTPEIATSQVTSGLSTVSFDSLLLSTVSSLQPTLSTSVLDIEPTTQVEFSTDSLSPGTSDLFVTKTTDDLVATPSSPEESVVTTDKFDETSVPTDSLSTELTAAVDLTTDLFLETLSPTDIYSLATSLLSSSEFSQLPHVTTDVLSDTIVTSEEFQPESTQPTMTSVIKQTQTIFSLSEPTPQPTVSSIAQTSSVDLSAAPTRDHTPFTTFVVETSVTPEPTTDIDLPPTSSDDLTTFTAGLMTDDNISSQAAEVPTPSSTIQFQTRQPLSSSQELVFTDLTTIFRDTDVLSTSFALTVSETEPFSTEAMSTSFNATPAFLTTESQILLSEVSLTSLAYESVSPSTTATFTTVPTTSAVVPTPPVTSPTTTPTPVDQPPRLIGNLGDVTLFLGDLIEIPLQRNHFVDDIDGNGTSCPVCHLHVTLIDFTVQPPASNVIKLVHSTASVDASNYTLQLFTRDSRNLGTRYYGLRAADSGGNIAFDNFTVNVRDGSVSIGNIITTMLDEGFSDFAGNVNRQIEVMVALSALTVTVNPISNLKLLSIQPGSVRLRITDTTLRCEDIASLQAVLAIPENYNTLGIVIGIPTVNYGPVCQVTPTTVVPVTSLAESTAPPSLTQTTRTDGVSRPTVRPTSEQSTLTPSVSPTVELSSLSLSSFSTVVLSAEPTGIPPSFFVSPLSTVSLGTPTTTVEPSSLETGTPLTTLLPTIGTPLTTLVPTIGIPSTTLRPIDLTTDQLTTRPTVVPTPAATPSESVTRTSPVLTTVTTLESFSYQSDTTTTVLAIATTSDLPLLPPSYSTDELLTRSTFPTSVVSSAQPTSSPVFLISISAEPSSSATDIITPSPTDTSTTDFTTAVATSATFDTKSTLQSLPTVRSATEFTESISETALPSLTMSPTLLETSVSIDSTISSAVEQVLTISTDLLLTTTDVLSSLLELSTASQQSESRVTPSTLPSSPELPRTTSIFPADTTISPVDQTTVLTEDSSLTVKETLSLSSSVSSDILSVSLTPTLTSIVTTDTPDLVTTLQSLTSEDVFSSSTTQQVASTSADTSVSSFLTSVQSLVSSPSLTSSPSISEPTLSSFVIQLTESLTSTAELSFSPSLLSKSETSTILSTAGPATSSFSDTSIPTSEETRSTSPELSDRSDFDTTVPTPTYSATEETSLVEETVLLLSTTDEPLTSSLLLTTELSVKSVVSTETLPTATSISDLVTTSDLLSPIFTVTTLFSSVLPSESPVSTTDITPTDTLTTTDQRTSIFTTEDFSTSFAESSTEAVSPSPILTETSAISTELTLSKSVVPTLSLLLTTTLTTESSEPTLTPSVTASLTPDLPTTSTELFTELTSESVIPTLSSLPTTALTIESSVPTLTPSLTASLTPEPPTTSTKIFTELTTSESVVPTLSSLPTTALTIESSVPTSTPSLTSLMPEPQTPSMKIFTELTTGESVVPTLSSLPTTALTIESSVPTLTPSLTASLTPEPPTTSTKIFTELTSESVVPTLSSLPTTALTIESPVPTLTPSLTASLTPEPQTTSMKIFTELTTSESVVPTLSSLPTTTLTIESSAPTLTPSLTASLTPEPPTISTELFTISLSSLSATTSPTPSSTPTIVTPTATTQPSTTTVPVPTLPPLVDHPPQKNPGVDLGTITLFLQEFRELVLSRHHFLDDSTITSLCPVCDLSMEILDYNKKPLLPSSLVQLVRQQASDSSSLYALRLFPIKGEVRRHQFFLRATDRANGTAEDGFQVKVLPPPVFLTHTILFDLDESFPLFSASRSRQIEVMAASAAVAGVGAQMILLQLHETNRSDVQLSNPTSSDVQLSNPTSSDVQLLNPTSSNVQLSDPPPRRIVHLELTNFALTECAAIPSLRIKFSAPTAQARLGRVVDGSMQVIPIRKCPDNVIIPGAGDDYGVILAVTDEKTGSTNTIAVVASVSGVLLLLALLACFIYRRRRPERMALDSYHQRRVFRGRAPALLEGEQIPASLRPGRAPAILPHEDTPPLRARTTSVRLAQIAEGDRHSIESLDLASRLPPAPDYHKPPPFHIAGSPQPKGPPPPYRVPPIYMAS